MAALRREAQSRSRSRGPSRAAGAAALLGALVTVALLLPSVASAATGCTAGPTVGTKTTWTCTIDTGTIGGYEVKQWYPLAPVPPQSGFITRMETDIVDENTGEQVPISRLMLHHIVFVNVARKDSTCRSYTGFDGRPGFGNFAPQRFFAAGEERAKMSLPDGYGYRTSQSDLWGVVAMVMNHRSAADRALIHYEVTIDTDPTIQAVTPYWFDVRDCRADPIYNIPGVKAKKNRKKLKKNRTSGEGKASPAGKRKGGKRHKRRRKPARRPTVNEARDYVIPQSGRFVAGAGHVHGGAAGLKLTEPNCGNREVARSDPTWGPPDHPFYNVRPILHEPGPINMSAFRSGTGLPVRAGETIRINSIYDNSRPHVRVMGILVAYLAPDASVDQSCEAVPSWEILKTDQPGRPGPIPFRIPLTGLDAAGQATTIDAPPGKTQRVSGGTTIPVGDRFFGAPNLRVRQGTTLNWQFNGSEPHNVTLANGPLGIGSENLDGGRSFSQRFNRPGVYRFFCALHPVQMQEKVIVTPKDKKKKRKRKPPG